VLLPGAMCMKVMLAYVTSRKAYIGCRAHMRMCACVCACVPMCVCVCACGFVCLWLGVSASNQNGIPNYSVDFIFVSIPLFSIYSFVP